jgi:hypothetical protein
VKESENIDKVEAYKIVVLLLGLGLLFFNYGNYWSAHWYSKWAYIMTAGTICFGIWVGSRTHWSVTPFVALIGIHAMYLGFWSVGPYFKMYGIAIVLSMAKSSLYGYCILLFAILFILLLPAKYKPSVEWFLLCVCLLSTLYTISQWGEIPYYRNAFSGNASMNGCLIAFSAPFLLEALDRKWIKFFALALVVLAVFLTGTSIPVGVLCGTSFVYFLAKYWDKIRKSIIPAALLVLGISSVGIFAWAIDPTLFNSNGRFQEWEQGFSWWAKHADPLLGYGLGTVQALYPTLQKTVFQSAPSGYFLWFHSEYLQVLWELGIFGLLAILPVVGYFFWHARHNAVLMSSLFGIALAALFNYPLRLPIHAMCLCCICWLIQLERDKILSTDLPTSTTSLRSSP